MKPKIKQKNMKAQAGNLSRRGQIGETVTWIVATVIIVVILAVSIFVSSITLGENKEFNFVRQADVFAAKSLYSYLLTKDGEGKIIYEQIKEDGNLDDFNGNLGSEIFKEFYEGKEYQQVWLGVSNYSRGLLTGTWNGVPNDYFGNKPRTTVVGFGGMSYEKDSLSNQIQLAENSSIELFLVGRTEND